MQGDVALRYVTRSSHCFHERIWELFEFLLLAGWISRQPRGASDTTVGPLVRLGREAALSAAAHCASAVECAIPLVFNGSSLPLASTIPYS